MRIERKYPFHKYFICLLALITVLFIVLRILINLFDFPLLLEISRDVDFNILLRGFHNGLRDFYKIAEMPPGIPDWPHTEQQPAQRGDSGCVRAGIA